MNTERTLKIEPSGQVSGFGTPLSPPPDYGITFFNGAGKNVGKLDFNGPAMTFTGDAEESAMHFFSFVAKSFSKRLEAEFEKGKSFAPKHVVFDFKSDKRLQAQLNDLNSANKALQDACTRAIETINVRDGCIRRLENLANEQASMLRQLDKKLSAAPTPEEWRDANERIQKLNAALCVEEAANRRLRNEISFIAAAANGRWKKGDTVLLSAASETLDKVAELYEISTRKVPDSRDETQPSARLLIWEGPRGYKGTNVIARTFDEASPSAPILHGWREGQMLYCRPSVTKPVTDEQIEKVFKERSPLYYKHWHTDTQKGVVGAVKEVIADFCRANNITVQGQK